MQKLSNTEFLKSSEISLDEIRAEIKGSIGKEILFYEKIGSTNTLAEFLAEKGKAEGTVVLAETQTKGRGRHGRSWVSPPSVNIYMSIILRPEIEPKDATLLTIMAAVGCTHALRRASGLNATIKWPNDLIVSEKKIGGILTDVHIEKKKLKFAVIGIGLNINMDLAKLPSDIKDIATSLKIETGRIYSRKEILVEVLNEIDYWYSILKGMNRKKLLREWELLTSTLGRKIKIATVKETLIGLAESINGEGMLVLKLPSGERRIISGGEVTLLR
ncbi:MAG: biotin--[acetyl-CoA-carboxylase] ligase [Nitrospirae bacterium]|nr:biotin--[acetyl-CoA-carboxylase] ligase [Nitrospirota bacterium]